MKLVTVASLLASPLILLAMFPAASVAEPLLPKFVWDTIPGKTILRQNSLIKSITLTYSRMVFSYLASTLHLFVVSSK